MTEITAVPEALKLLNTLVAVGPSQIWDHHQSADALLAVAMVKGARAVLKEWENLDDRMKHNANQFIQMKAMIVSIANAYRPAMVELGWWPK